MRLSAAVLCLLMFGACAPWFQNYPDLVEQGTYHLETYAIDRCGMEAEIREKSGKLVVQGKMTFRHHPSGPVSATAFVEVISPQGAVLARRQTSFIAVPHGRRSHPAARFEVEFDFLPPSGSLFRIRHEMRPYSEGDAGGRIR